MLQCHPHPGGFSDKSRPFHCCYFMGLQRKQGVPANEGEQFDIRLTVDEFKHSVGVYTLWKPGMEIHVSHVRRRNIPSFVFPGGVRPSRPTKVAGERRQVLEPNVVTHAVIEGVEDGRKRKREDENVVVKKRKQEDENVDTNLRNAKSLDAASSRHEILSSSPHVSTVSPSSIKGDSVDVNMLDNTRKEKVEHNTGHGLTNLSNSVEVPQNGEVDGSLRCTEPIKPLPSSGGSSSSKEAEKIAIEKIMSGPYVSHQAFPEELDELEDDVEYRDQVKNLTGSTQGSSTESSKANVAEEPLTTTSGSVPCTNLSPNGGLEELEVSSANPIIHICAYMDSFCYSFVSDLIITFRFCLLFG